MASLIKMDKDGNIIDSIDIQVDGVGMVLSHYLDSVNADHSTLTFTISTTSTQIPFLNNPDFYVAIREKVDLTMDNVYNQVYEDKDIGSENYRDGTPYQPRYLPFNFIELKGE